MKTEKIFLGILILLTACTTQKKLKDLTTTTEPIVIQEERLDMVKTNTATNTQEKVLEPVENSNVITFKAEHKKIPEMKLNIWIFNYTPETTLIEGAKTALLVNSDTSNNPTPFSEFRSQIFLDSNYKVVHCVHPMNKEVADSIVKKVFSLK